MFPSSIPMPLRPTTFGRPPSWSEAHPCGPPFPTRSRWTVAGHLVTARTGFEVVWGPVRAEDIPAFLEAGGEATPEMRRVRFPITDRAALIPVELVGAAKLLLPVLLVVFLLGGMLMIYGGG